MAQRRDPPIYVTAPGRRRLTLLAVEPYREFADGAGRAPVRERYSRLAGAMR